MGAGKSFAKDRLFQEKLSETFVRWDDFYVKSDSAKFAVESWYWIYTQIMGREFNVADKLMLSKNYKEHHLFKELDEMMDFYEAVSDRAFCFLPSGTKGLKNNCSLEIN